MIPDPVMLAAVVLSISMGFSIISLVLLCRGFDQGYRVGRPKATRGLVSVIIAARNEQLAIGNTLQGILAQGPVVRDVIVVDDESTDRTANIVDSVRLANKRVRLLKSSKLPLGWTGKTHALNIGARAASGDMLLFTDADVEFQGQAIESAVDYALSSNVDHISAVFCNDCRTIGERLCAPLLMTIAVLSVLGSYRFGKGAALGAFNLIKRDRYDTWGGHDTIRDHVVDDVALARLVRKSGGTSRVLDLSQAVKVRLFVGIRGFWHAVCRSALPFLSWPWPLVVASGLVVLIAALYLLGGALGLVVIPVLFERGYEMKVIVPLSSCALTYSILLIPVLKSHRFVNCHMAWGVAYPLPLLIMAVAVVYSAGRVALGMPVVWKGREYRLSNTGIT